MVYPMEMTLATGTTVYAGDPGSDEQIASREVRVSVTYRIEEQEDFDLADFAHARAAEVERARLAAQERLERDRTDPYEAQKEPAFGHDEASFDPSDPSLEPPDEEAVPPDPFPQEADYLCTHCSPAPGGGRPANQECHGYPPLPPASPAGAERIAGTDKASGAVNHEETDWATKPQVLALGSHFRRLGLTPENQTALLRTRFGKFRPERLSKDEAAGLMRFLERGELPPAQGPVEPAALAH